MRRKINVFNTAMPVVAFCCIAASAPAADLAIEQFAPQSSVIVVSHPGAEGLYNRIKETPLMKMLEGSGDLPEWELMNIEELLDSGSGPLSDAMRTMHEEGTLIENMAKITMGLAMYTSEDPETGGILPHILMFLDYSSQDDEMRSAITELVNDAGKDAGETLDISGRECFVKPGTEGDDPQGGGFSMGPDISALQTQDTYLCMDEEASVLLMATSVSGMQRAIEALEGEAVADPLSDSDDWKGIQSMIGGSGPSIVLLTSHLGDMVSAFDSSGMMGFLGGTLVAATGRINAIGIHVEEGENPTLLRAKGGLYMPEGKSGLVELISKNTDREALPPLLETEIYGLARYNFDFGGLIDWIKGIIRSNPFIQAQGMQSLQQIEPTLSALMDSLKDSVISMESISRPITKNSVISIMAMESNDTQKFNDAFTVFASDMGMEQGDFQGHTIYTMENATTMPGMFGSGVDEIAVAMGGDYVMMGNRSGIEEALRNVGNRGELELSPNLKAAFATLPDRPLSGWSVQDIFRFMDDAMEIDELQMEQSLKELAEDDAELAEEIRAEMKEERKMQAGLLKELAESLAGYSVAMWSIDDGMVFQVSLLEIPADEEKD